MPQPLLSSAAVQRRFSGGSVAVQIQNTFPNPLIPQSS